MSEPAGRSRDKLGYQPSLDAFRAIAILLVVFYHDRNLPGGFVGVDLFFVLSGFLITTILREEWDETGSINLKGFYVRRLLRLAPALVAYVAVSYVVTHAIRPQLSNALRPEWAVATLLYVSNLLIAFGREYPMGLVSVHWSLGIEEQFYLLWPFCFRLFFRRGFSRGRVACLLVAGSVGSALIRWFLLHTRVEDPTLWLRVYFAPDTRADALLIGCALSLVLAARGLGADRALGALAAACGALGLVPILIRSRIIDMTTHPYLFSLTALASAGILFGLMQGGRWVRLLEWGPLVWLGRLSYSLYLWHMVGLEIAAGTGRLGKAVALLGLAIASHYLVERPFLELKARFGPAAVAAPRAERRSRGVWRGAQVAAGLAILLLLTSAGYARLAQNAGAVAMAEARDRLAARPDDPDRLVEFGEALTTIGDLPGTLEALGRAAKLRPRDPMILAALGHALRAMGRPGEAAAQYRQALELDPRHSGALVGVGELALDQDRLTEAIAAFSRAREVDPANVSAHTGLGIAYAVAGDLEQAVPHFSEAARLRPSAATRGNLEKALADLARSRSPAR